MSSLIVKARLSDNSDKFCKWKNETREIFTIQIKEAPKLIYMLYLVQ